MCSSNLFNKGRLLFIGMVMVGAYVTCQGF